MANKGRSIIQLIRDDTKKVDEQLEKLIEYKDENIITNAISNAANRPFEYRLRDNMSNGGDSYISNFYQSLLPLPTNGLGGILLWESHLDNNPDNVIPPTNIQNVGYAGNAYAGTNSRRGSYNQNESGNITNGFRNVWDFGTDKCNNVDINAITLTNKLCGDLGFAYNADIASNTTMFGLVDRYSNERVLIESNYTYPIYFEDKFTCISIRYIGSRNLELWKTTMQDCSNIDVNTPNMRHTVTAKLADIALPGGVGNQFPSIIKDGNILHIVKPTSTTNRTIFHTRINLTDYTVTNLNLSLTSATQNLGWYTKACCFYNDNYYISHDDDSIGVYSVSGAFLRYVPFPARIASSNSDYRYFSKYKNALYLTATLGSDNNVGIMISTVDGVSYSIHHGRLVSTSAMYHVDNDYIKYPLMMMGYGSIDNRYGCNIIGTYNYLGSINNLSNTIRKTSDYNMKIIYELTNE